MMLVSRSASFVVGPTRSGTTRGLASRLSAAPATTEPRVVGGLRELADEFDVFLLDQFGVLHNGDALLPGVADALATLASRGKRLIVLSNTASRRRAVEAKLPAQGFESAWLTGVVTSGEAAHAELASLRFRGARCAWLGWARGALADAHFLDGTDVTIAPFADADVILVQGPDTIVSSEAARGVLVPPVGDGAPRDMMPPIAGVERTGLRESGALSPALAEGLASCAARGVPLLCCNSDLVALSPGGARWTMPGVVAARYEALGGPVSHFGKPTAPPFRLAREIALAAGGAAAASDGYVAGSSRPLRICHVGDSLHHDVAGAHAAGVASAFVVETGIHRGDALEAGWCEPGGGGGGAAAAVGAIAAREGVPVPTFALPRFAW